MKSCLARGNLKPGMSCGCRLWSAAVDRLLGRVVTVRNITEKKQTEEALRLSEEKYRNIYENVADVIYETDNQGHLTSISPSVEKQGGYRPEELIGRNVTEFFVFPDQYAALDALMHETWLGQRF